MCLNKMKQKQRNGTQKLPMVVMAVEQGTELLSTKKLDFHLNPISHSMGGREFRLLEAKAGPGCWSPTSDLLLQAQDDLHSLLEDDELGLGLVTLQMELAHAAQLPEGLVDVTYAYSLPCVVGQAPLPVPLLFLLHCQTLL